MTEPSTSWREQVEPGEEASFEALAKRLRAVQEGRSRPVARALHVKGHGGLLGELRVRADVPAWARVGVFAEPGTYRAYVRFSNGSGDVAPDRAPDVRGIAVKLVGVPGEKLIPPLRDAKTQDFLAILTPAVPFRTPAEFVGVVEAASGSPLLALPRILRALGLRAFTVLPALQKGLSAPVASVADRTYHSALPIRWGAYAVKYSFASKASVAEGPPNRSNSNYLRDELAGRTRQGPLSFELRVQAYLDEERTPIEDPTLAWDIDASPHVTIADLELPAVDPTSARAVAIAAFVEKLSFDPWHAPVDFRPLGAMMRARNAAYRESTSARGAAPEPDGAESFG